MTVAHMSSRRNELRARVDRARQITALQATLLAENQDKLAASQAQHEEQSTFQ